MRSGQRDLLHGVLEGQKMYHRRQDDLLPARPHRCIDGRGSAGRAAGGRSRAAGERSAARPAAPAAAL